MAAYFQLSDLNGEIPPQFLVQALDDDNDGIIDAWDAVQQLVQEDVDSMLEGRFALPLTFSPMPVKIKTSCVALACERLYRRRGTADDANPFTGRANAARKLLSAITVGDLKLSVLPHAEDAAVDPAASVIIHETPLGPPGRLLG